MRVVIQQPSLAKYRVPVFRELSLRPGVELTVVHGARPDLPNAPADGFQAVSYPLRLPRLAGVQLGYHAPQWQWATRRKADVLVLTWNTRYLSLLPGLLRARAHRVPTVLWGHGYSKREQSWRSGLRRSVHSLATALLFYNRTVAESYRQAGVPNEKIFVALNSLDQAPIARQRQAWLENPTKLDAFREQHGVAGRQVILFVSRLDPANRLDLLVQALPQVLGEAPTATAVIIGSGQAEQQRLESLARELGVADKIRFLGAIYDESQLAPWFLAASAFCYPANIGLSILHAMGYGLPVVTSDATERQNPEIEALRAGYNGMTYRDGSARDLARCLVELVTNGALRRTLSEGALATIAGDFNVPQMVDGMEAAIRYAHGCTNSR